MHILGTAILPSRRFEMSRTPKGTLPELNKSGRFYINYPTTRSQISVAPAFSSASSTSFSKSYSLYYYLHRQQVRTVGSPTASQNALCAYSYQTTGAKRQQEGRKPLNFRFQSVIGRRPTNEDSELIFGDPQGRFHVIGVFDGHGGEKVSRLCAQELPRAFVADFGKAAVNEVFRHSIEHIEEIAFANQQLDEQGCTFCSAFIDKSKVVLCNVGDSRALVGLYGKGYKQTKDHSPDDKHELERLLKIPGVFVSNEFGVKRVQGSLCLSRAIGDKFMKPFGVISQPDFFEVPREQCEWLCIACDGLFDMLTSDYLSLVIRSLIAGSNLGGSQDERDLIYCALFYYTGRLQDGNALVETLVGDTGDASVNCCQIDKDACVEQKICQVLCKLAFQLGSTDNISVIFGFL